ncbi:MAG: hypothetical protein U9Q83_06610 [Bacteroidota bacterium]|nr:hypothetical protein [Bacteroidota bacterium]
MKNKILIIIIAFFSISISANAQQKPQVILPGNTVKVNAKKDTLWIMSNYHFKKSIIAKKQLKICNKQVNEQKKILDNLKLVNENNAIIIDTLKNDRNYYVENWEKAEKDVNTLANMNDKCSKHLKIAIIVGATTTVVAFLAGFFIGI